MKTVISIKEHLRLVNLHYSSGVADGEKKTKDAYKEYTEKLREKETKLGALRALSDIAQAACRLVGEI